MFDTKSKLNKISYRHFAEQIDDFDESEAKSALKYILNDATLEQAIRIVRKQRKKKKVIKSA